VGQAVPAVDVGREAAARADRQHDERQKKGLDILSGLFLFPFVGGTQQRGWTCIRASAECAHRISLPMIDRITATEFSAIPSKFSAKLRDMAASLYIVVEGDDPGFDIFVNGQCLARNEDALERLAERLNVRPLLEFFSADENSMALLLEQGAADPDWSLDLPQPQWYDAPDGLRTVQTLIDFLADAPVALGSETQPVLAELREYERVLHKTAEYGLRWHVAVSWR